VVDRSPKFLPVVLDAQLMPGIFEYALDFLVDNELDLSCLDGHCKNDATGTPAYDPAMMQKVALLANCACCHWRCSLHHCCTASGPTGRCSYCWLRPS